MSVWVRQNLFFMEQHRKLLIAFLLLLFAISGTVFALDRPADAQVATTNNKAISFSARLKSANGQTAPDGLYNVSFRLYNGSEGGTPLWTETFYDENGVGAGQDNRIRITNGYLQAKLGSRTPFTSDINWDGDLWLTMNIGGTTQIGTVSNIPWDGEMSPRIQLNAVPYALSAGSLNGRTADDFVQLGQGTQTNSSDNPSISINTTGQGDLIQLQKNAEDVFTVDNAGNISFGSSSDHTISIDEAEPDTDGSTLAISGGDGGEGDTDGGNLVLSGGAGSGSGADGLVILSNATFATTTNDGNCYPAGALAAANCVVTQQTVDSSSAVIIGFSEPDQTATLPDPTVATPGRILYIMAANDSQALSLITNGDESITMQPKSALTLLWNGSDWIVAGHAGSSNNGPIEPEITEEPPAEEDITIEEGEVQEEMAIDPGENTGDTTTTEAPVETEPSGFLGLQLGQSDTAPAASPGTMYYDTTLGKVQCLEASGWGNCGDAPDTFMAISPEYKNAVMNGTDIGIISSDFCSGSLGINDGSKGQPVVCAPEETYNFYRWTTDEEEDQTRSIYLTYQLPENFKGFVDGSTAIMGRTDSDNALVDYQVYRDDGNGLLSCGSPVTVSQGFQTNWQKGLATEESDPVNCEFEAGDSILFRINLTAKNTANAYVSNVNFIFRNS